MANFFILVFILYRFLFNPLKKAMQKREEQVTSAMDEAAKAKQEAEKVRQEYEQKSDNIDADIAARKNEARIVIEQTRQQMLSEVQEKVEHLRRQAEESMDSLRAEAIQQHKKEIADLVAQFAREMMTDLMNPQIHKLYQEEFLEKIEGIDLSKFVEGASPNELQYIKAIMATQPDKDFQKRLETVVKEKITIPFDLTSEIDDKLIAGGILRFENELIDGSLGGQINKLKKQYQENA
jgi:F-type H+-transporting ATPase subunit b